jgi:hypothetical protein
MTGVTIAMSVVIPSVRPLMCPQTHNIMGPWLLGSHIIGPPLSYSNLKFADLRLQKRHLH